MRPREMTAGQALLWTMGAAILLWVGLGIMAALRPASTTDIVSVGAVEASALLLATYFVLRVYASDRGVLAALGVRPTQPGLIAIAVALGTVLHVPAESLRRSMEVLVPSPESELGRRALLLGTDEWSQALVLLVVVACVVPLVEEVLVRGALFGPLVRSTSASTASAATALAFVVLHLLQWRNAPALLLAGGVLSYLRGASGSLLPPLAMHVAFNATTVLALWTGVASATQPIVLSWPLAIGGWVATLVLIGTAQRLSGKSPEAAAARAEDET